MTNRLPGEANNLSRKVSAPICCGFCAWELKASEIIRGEAPAGCDSRSAAAATIVPTLPAPCILLPICTFPVVSAVLTKKYGQGHKGTCSNAHGESYLARPSSAPGGAAAALLRRAAGLHTIKH